MRSGKWRGVTLACSLVLAMGALRASAQDFHAIPRLVPAVTYDTGEPYNMPTVPYGHYVGKDIPGKLTGHLAGLKSGLLGHLGGLGHGAGCGVPGCGGVGMGGGPCGHRLGGHKATVCPDGNCGTLGATKVCGIGGCSPIASGQSFPATATVMPAGPCGIKGCGMPFGKHRHAGCGNCGGSGCGNCAVPNACGACGGRGCAACGGLGHLAGLHGKASGLVGHLLGQDKIKWFVGPGGPVPLTPGYTPYVVTTRSPRDFFAFPPMSPDR